MSSSDHFFSTEVPDLRPLTNVGTRRFPSDNNTHLQLKILRERAKGMQRDYLEQKIHHDRLRKNVEHINHQSALKRVEFLKVYSNKKAKYHTRELLQTHKQQRQNFERKSLELVKRRKLEYQLQQILLQNEEEDRIYQLQKANKRNKELLRKELLLANQRDMACQHSQEVRKGNTQFMIRKRNLQTSVTLRSKQNYYVKVNQELSLIQNYEKILDQIESFTRAGPEESKLQNSTECNTIERGQTMFLTSKNTIQ